MLRTVLLLSSICSLVKSSGVAVAPLPLAASIAPVGPPIPPFANAPVVTAASSQYFQRTFNRLVVPHAIAPVAPVAPPPPAPVFPLAPAPTVFVEPTRTIPVAVNPQLPPEPVQPNVAIAIATAQSAAPVATILLPPYPFGYPPTFGYIPSEQPVQNPDESTKEPTTQRTTEIEATTTPQPATTTPIDTSSSDNNFVQALPSNENVNFNLYGPPPPPGSPAQFLPQIPNAQSQAQSPNPQFNPQWSNSQFHPQPPNQQLQPQRPNPQSQPQQPNQQFQPQRPNQQFQPQQPNQQFQPQQPQQHIPQFQPQQLEFPPYPPKQQHQQQNQLQQRPQQPRPQYIPPKQQTWKQQKVRPQKLKTSVEVVPVPLAYITPPPLHKTHAHVKVLRHVYSYAPAHSPKIIIKHVKVHPARLMKHKVVGVRLQNLRAADRDIEITTVNPFRRPNTKPPRL